MKTKAFFEKLERQAKIENTEFKEFISKLPDDLELPDVAANLIEDNFLTRDRAMSDPKIVKKIKAEVLNGADEALKKVFAVLSPEDRAEIEVEENTYKKIESLNKYIPKMLEKAGSQVPNTDEKVKQLEKNNQELLDKIKVINSDYDAKVKTFQKEYDQKEKGMRLDWTLDKELGKYTFAQDYVGIKEAIIKNVVTDLKGKHTLQLNDKGEIVIVELDSQTGVATPKFDGNDQVTIEKVLLPVLEPFLKKNNAGEEKKPANQAQAKPAGAQQSTAAQFQEERRRAKPNTPILQ